jgi:hypothetical protein
LKVKDNAQLGIASYRKFADYRERLKHEHALAHLLKDRRDEMRIRVQSLVKLNPKENPHRLFLSLAQLLLTSQKMAADTDQPCSPQTKPNLGMTKFRKRLLTSVATMGFAAVISIAAGLPAGSDTIGVSEEELKAVMHGWSAKKKILGKPVYNDDNKKSALSRISSSHPNVGCPTRSSASAGSWESASTRWRSPSVS